MQHRRRPARTGLMLALELVLLPLTAEAQDRLRAEPVADAVSEFRGIVLRLDQSADANQVLATAGDSVPAANFLRLRLIISAPSRVQNVTAEVRDRGNELVDSINLDGMQGVQEVWTNVIPGNEFRVQLKGAPQPAGSSFSVWQMIRDIESPAALSVIGNDDRKPLRDYPDQNVRAAGRAVAKILFQNGSQMIPCTGFLISATRMITNQHCVGTAEVCKTVSVLFDYDTSAMVPASKQRRCGALKKADVQYDFTVFDLDKAADPTIRPLTLGGSSPGAQTKLLLIQHPGGQPKQISEIGCESVRNPVTGRVAESDFSHSCDTLNGSSGSPVLNTALQVVGLHHFGTDVDQPQFNRAVRIEPIAQRVLGIQ